MAKRRMNNEGSIYYRKDRNRWIYEYSINNKRKSISAKTQKELKDKIKEIQSMIYTNNVKEETYKTVKDIAMIIANNKLALNQIGANSYQRRLYNISTLSPILDIPVFTLEEKNILELYKSLVNYSDSTIQKAIITLREIINYSLDRQYMLKDITKNIPKPKSIKKKKDIVALTITEQKKLLEIIDDAKYAIVYKIQLYTGLRVGEVLNLTIDDIDFKKSVIKINKTITKDIHGNFIFGKSTKTNSGIREVPISNKLKNVLKNYLNTINTNYLFIRNNQPFNHTILNLDLRRLNNKYNITSRLSTHVFRHTFATRCIESGMPAVILSKILGHSDVSITLNTYTSVFDEYQNKYLENAFNYMDNL